MGWLEQRNATGLVVNKRELAELLDVSEVTLDAWLKEGMPVIDPGSAGVPGRYDTADVIRWACLREIGKQRTASSFDKLNDIRTRREELNLERDLGQVVYVKDIRPAFERWATHVDGILAGLRDKYVLQLESADGPEAKDAVLADMIDEIRDAMSDYEHSGAPAPGGNSAVQETAEDQPS